MFMKEYDVITKKISKISQYDITESHVVKKSYSEDKSFSCRVDNSFIFISEDEYNNSIFATQNISEHYIGITEEDLKEIIEQKCRLIISICDFLHVEEYWNRIRIFEIEKEQYFKKKNSIEKYMLQKYEIYVGVSGTDCRGGVIRVNRRISGDLFEINQLDKQIYYNIYSATRELKKRFNNRIVEEKSYECVFLPEVASLMVHEYIGHLSEEDIWKRNGNYPIGYDFKNNINVYDIGSCENNKLLPCPIWTDDDGCETKKTCIIKNGIFNEVLSMISDAKADSSGNARIGMKGRRQIRMRNTFLKEGKNSIKDMLGGIEHGYMFSGAFLGSMSEGRGVELLLHMGFEIEKGKIIGTIENVFMSDTIDEVISNISAISSKVEWFGNLCSKKGEMIYVGMGAPAIKTRVKLRHDSIFNE